MAKLSQDDIKQVTGQGFLINRGTEMFSGRVLPGNGVFTAKEMMKIADCAEKFGNGKITMTSRLAVELPGIHFDDIEPAKAFLAEEGLLFGGTGAKICLLYTSRCV